MAVDYFQNTLVKLAPAQEASNCISRNLSLDIERCFLNEVKSISCRYKRESPIRQD